MHDYRTRNRQHFMDYFMRGCKEKIPHTMLGLELEHFIIDTSTKESITYFQENGIEAIMNSIASRFEKKMTSQGHLIGLENADYTLTLEPAAQIEISISPQHSILKIYEIYQSFLSLISPVLHQYGYELACYGYLPKNKAMELPLIPKKRYEYMNQYFNSIGNYGAYMMRGTASTQVSIDYVSEHDFSDKYRIVYTLTPFFALLCFNTPVFEGVINQNHLNRIRIWDQVDRKRVNISPFMKNETIDFSGYIDFLYHVPAIVNKKNSEEEYSEKTIGQLAGEREFDDEELEHYLSMVFPPVRLKKYIEIRMADSMPVDSVLVYLALLKGIYRNLENSKQFVNRLIHEADNDMQSITEQLMEHGMDAKIGSLTVHEILTQLYDLAYNGVEEEQPLLLSMKRNITEKGTLLSEGISSGIINESN